MRRREIHSEIEIAAPPGEVWAVLTDFEAFPEWNPFLRSVQGRPETGATLAVSVATPGGAPRIFRTRIIEVAPERLLTSVGRFPIPGMLEGEHSFVIAPSRDDERCLLIQHQNFSGLLTPLVDDEVAAMVRSGFDAMNLALKERAEQVLAEV